MADDIMWPAYAFDDWGWDDINGWHDPEDDPASPTEAVLLDEIKRLRTELAEAYDACRYALADSPRWQENCATVIATWEARRG